MPAQTVIKLRRDTAADWTTTDPILAAGELGIETDTNRIKIGDGITEWTGLKYGPVGDELVIRVKNASNTTAIPPARLVQFAGAAGDTVTAAPAVTNGTVDFHNLIGVTAAEIPADGFGDVVLTGAVTGIATNAYAAGTLLYADPANAGQLTSTAPSAPNFKEPVAAVVRSGAGTSGIILVRLLIGSSLNDIHDVQLGTPSSGQVLQYDGTKWVNATVDALPSQTGNAGELLVTDGTTASWSNTVTANSASSVGLTVKAAASQTERIQRWQSSAGSELAYIGPTGTIGTVGNLIAIGVSGIGNSGSTSHQLLVSATSSTRIGTTIRGAAAQTANLLELHDSASTVLASVSSAGVVTAPSFVPSSSTAPTNGMYLSAANNVSFSTGSTRRATLSSLGLGVVQNLFIGEGVGSSSAFIEVGNGRTADGNAYIDLISDTTYTDYGARFIRSTGANGFLSIINRGTGGIIIEATEAGYIALQTTNITRMTIAATGEVGIGASPITTDMLYVNTVSAANTGLLIRGVASQTGNLQEWQNSSGTILARVDSSGRFVGDGSQLTGIAAGESVSPLLLMGA